jgi:hypothetical protein
MNAVLHKTVVRSRIIPYIALFLFCAFFLYGFAPHIFYYQEKSSLFLVTFSYLRQHLEQPGGFLEYLAQLQTTFYYYPLVGALTVSVQICVIIWLINRTGRRLGAEHFLFVSFVVGAILFYLQTNYQYQAINNLGIFFQLLLFYTLIGVTKKFRWIAPVMLPLSYYLFGSYASLSLGMLTVFFITERNWPKLAMSWLAPGAFFWIGKEFFFYPTTHSLLIFPFSITGIGGQVGLFSVAGLFMLFVPLLVKIKLKPIQHIKIRHTRLSGLTPYLVLMLLIAVSIPRIDEKSSHYFHAEKLFYAQKFDELIHYNSTVRTNNKITLFLNNVALAETGRLGASFFSFPQSTDGSTLFLKWENIEQFLRLGGYYYYSIGVVNEAQRWAYEYTVIYGYTPETLKMLIKTELIKGNYKTAEKYISILEKSVFYRKEAGNFRKLLNNDEAVLADKELGAKKRMDAKLDFFVQSDEPWLNLLPVLEADSSNPVALEYELAWLMLQKDMKGIVKLLPAMEKAGFTKIPKNVEEAVVTYKLLRVGEMPELKKLEIDPGTEQRFERYYKLFQQNQGNKLRAQKALQEFADTYWYYVFFDQ